MRHMFLKTRLFTHLVFLCFVSKFNHIALCDDWAQWRGPNRNGMTNSEVTFDSSTKFLKVWSAELGTGFASVVVADGQLIGVGNVKDHDIVTCLDAKSGEQLWTFEYEEPLDPNLFEGGPTGTPLIDGGLVFTISRRGKIHCLELSSGDVRWQFDVSENLKVNIPTWGFTGSPVRFEDGVIFNVGEHGLCLDRQTGAILWSSPNGIDAGYSSPIMTTIDGVAAVFLMNGKAANAVHAGDGALLWSERWITRYGINAADPIVLSENRLLVSSGYGKGTALLEFDQESAELVWRNRDLRNQMSPGVLVENTLYAVDGDAGDEAKLVCLNPENGEIHWEYSLGGTGSLIGVGSSLLLLEESGKLTVFSPDANQFTSVMSQQVSRGKCWTPPIFADSMLYVRNAAGSLTCLTVQ